MRTVTREEYRRRIAGFRGLAAVFRGGRLEAGQSGGSGGMLFLRTPDGKEWFVGGSSDPAVTRATAAALNLVLDLCERSEDGREPAGRGPGRDRPLRAGGD